MSKKTTVLCIMDGFGLRDEKDGNAVALAKKPNLDNIFSKYNMVPGQASGVYVGLPEGQMGNSEVGHLNIGAGRIVYQDLTRISKAIDSSPDLRDKKELIDQFIEKLTPNSEVDAAWHLYVNAEKRRQFDAIVEEEHLKREQAVEFIENAYERGYVPEGGMELDGIMPPINPFDANANREGKIATVLEKLKVFFKRFSDISDGVFRSEEVTEIKKRSKKAQEIQMVPQGSMLEDVEADDDVRRLVHNMMELYEGTTIMNIVVECQKEYQERYFSMKTNDWRHLLRDYVRKVTERPELQEDEVFRYVMAG